VSRLPSANRLPNSIKLNCGCLFTGQRSRKNLLPADRPRVFDWCVEYKLSYCLRSDKHPDQNMIVNNRTWYQLLELAEAYGWNPMGTMLPEWLAGLMEWMSRGEAYPEGLGGGSYTPISSRLVVLEDTLNMADALERAFLAYEPAPVRDAASIHRTEWDDFFSNNRKTAGAVPEPHRPAMGVVLMLIDLCRQGAFWIQNI
jgi:hypothetical protein